MKKITLFFLCIVTVTILKAATGHLTLNVITPGTAYTLFDFDDASATNHLTITGDINAKDLNNLTVNFFDIDTLDLSNANLKAIDDQWGTYADNELPEACFSYGNKLKYVILPSNLEIIGNNVFDGKEIVFEISPTNTNFIIENNVVYNLDKSEIFYVDRTLTGTFSIPYGVKTIGSTSFYGTSIATVNIPNTVTFIEKNAFDNSDISSLTIPESITAMDRYAFETTKLQSITIPPTIDILGVGCFNDSDLETIILKHVPNCKQYVFSANTTLSNVYNYEEIPAYFPYSSVFENSNQANCTLTVPYGTKEAYSIAQVWKDFGIIKEMVNFTSSSETIKIRPSETENWTVTSSTPWVTVSPSSGTSTDSLTITVTGNTSLEERIGSITITTLTSNEVTIFQEALKVTTAITNNYLEKTKVYPNPAHSYITISSSNKEPITIYNNQGKVVLQTKINGEEKIDISHLPNGVYFLKDQDNIVTILKK
ncbi:MAG: leucine-rich repeat protein [Bacteroidales bacterium]|jgi:hypothetical protein|nr:leucine-rich repeat protein [Bacteroidales bacterium]